MTLEATDADPLVSTTMATASNDNCINDIAAASTTAASTTAASTTAATISTSSDTTTTSETSETSTGEVNNTVPTSEPPTQSVESPTSQRPLLREWSQSTTPVAPAVAVVLDGNDESPGLGRVQSNGYSYPVATFVSNLVRNTYDEIRDHIEHHIYTGAVAESSTTTGDMTRETLPLSVRSEGAPAMRGLVCPSPPMAASSLSSTQQPIEEAVERRQSSSTAALTSVRSMNDVSMDESSEFVLIDGDLVHVSPYNDSERDSDSYTFPKKDCHSNRMRRGVKGIKKWIKKKRLLRRSNRHITQQHQQEQNQLQQQQQHQGHSGQSLRQQTSAPPQDLPQVLENQPMTSALPPPPPTAPESHSPMRRKTKKKKRFAWLLDIESRTGSQQQQQQQHQQQKLLPQAPSQPPPDERLLQQQHKPPPPPPPPEMPTSPASLAPPPPSSPPPASLPHEHHSLLQQSPPRNDAVPGSLSLDMSADASDVLDPLWHGPDSAPSAPSFAAAPSTTQSFSHPPMVGRQASIAAEASFIGHVDQLVEAGVLPGSVAAEAYIEDRMDDYDKYDDKKKDYGYFPASVVPASADYKVDKQEAPCVDSMLRRAGEFTDDLETSAQECLTPDPRPPGKSDGSSVPLSIATSNDPDVHNDILKIVMVGAPDVDKSSLARTLRQTTKKSKQRKTLAVDVHKWTPPNKDNVKFTIWDVQGVSDVDQQANFGAHPGTQSLFFSDRSLYLLVWDLGLYNPKTYRRSRGDIDDDSDSESDADDDDDDGDDVNNLYVLEEANRYADRALRSDIEDRVLSWVDCIARRGPNSAILPVALVPADTDPFEVKRRCDALQSLLMNYAQQKLIGPKAPMILAGADNIICVSLENDMGVGQLQETVVAIATDASKSVFDHVGTPVPPGTILVLESARRLKQDHKLVLVDHLLADLDTELSVMQVTDALHFLSGIGELLYFGGDDDVLSQYVILNRKWLVSALSCVLRNDLKRELSETRRFMTMQCIYSDQQFPENPVTQTFSGSTSNCPLLSSTDTQMLWQSMSFMREAADRTSQLSENSTTCATMFSFLERLLVHTGVFLPLDVTLSSNEVYFVPSLLSLADRRDIWTFKSSDSWMTTLSHTWLFRDGAPSGIMEHVTTNMLRDLYEFSHSFASRSPKQTHRSQTYPFGHSSLTEFMDNNEGEMMGHIKIRQVMCWKSSVLVKIGCVFADGDEFRESFVEVFVTIADQASPHCVAADVMRPSMQRLIVSGKGQVGHHGRKLWKGGYGIIVDSIKATLADCANVDRQVVCPECLARAHPNSASTWSWDSVRAASHSGNSDVRCMRGHCVDANLLCGTCAKPSVPKMEPLNGSTPKKPVKDLLPSVVVVGLWDCNTKTIRNVGSGFVADKNLGLVVTAGHVLFDMQGGRQFGTPYFGLKNAKAVVGVIADDGNTAVFRYSADIVADDINNVDACVLRITTRLEHDVDSEEQIGEQPEKIVTNASQESLCALKTTRKYEIEQAVRILGYNQGGEGVLEKGKHVNRSADFARGYICKQFKMADDGSNSSSLDSSNGSGFVPREEIVIICPTISGHSGGPCVNDEGKVVGILSRADPVDRQRCYLVPASEIKILMKEAKKYLSRGNLKMYPGINV